MASAWGSSWGSSWGGSWGAVGERYNPSNLDGHVRMYGGGGFGGSAYRVKDEDVESLMKVLFKVRKKRKKKAAKAKEFEAAAVALLNAPHIPAVKQIVVDSVTPLLMRGRARQAELQSAVEALLVHAEQLRAEYEREIAEDDEDVLMLLGAL